MATADVRTAIRRERAVLRGMLWVWPAVCTMVALLLGTALSFIDIGSDSALEPVLFGGSADEARRLLLSIATTVVSVLALVIGLTMVAVQVASNRYSPRLLRNFLRDKPLQLTLGLFVATFVYNAAGLYTLRERTGDTSDSYPRLAVTVGLTLLFVCIGALLLFVDRMVHSIQIDTVLAKIGKTTSHTIAKEPPGVGGTAGAADLPEEPGWAVPIRAKASGYVQHVDLTLMSKLLVGQEVHLRLVPMVGEHVIEGSPLAWAWRASPEQALDVKQVSRALAGSVPIGIERTRGQDVALGLVQIVDIALLSMHIYDFHTVIQATEELAVLAGRLCCYPLGEELFHVGRSELQVPARRFEEYLDLACGPIRRRGVGEPVISRALLRLLHSVGMVAETEEHRSAVAAQVRLVLATAERSISEADDLANVRDEAATVLAAVERGRVSRA